MFVFEFDRSLFRFNAARPALEPLFQLPPRIGKRCRTRPEILFSGILNPTAQHLSQFHQEKAGGLVFLVSDNFQAPAGA